MGVRGVRRGNTAQQIESQTKTAAAALLTVMNLLQREGKIELSEEWASYFAAVGRRLEWIRSRTSSASAAPVEHDSYATCANCAESIIRSRTIWVHERPYETRCTNAVPTNEGAR